MRFVLLAIGLLIANTAVAGNTGVLLADVPQVAENKAAVVAAVKSAFLARHWTIQSADGNSVTATIAGKVTTSRMQISVSGNSLVYDESTTRIAQASRAPSASLATVKAEAPLGGWLENIRRDVTVNVAAIPVRDASTSVTARTITERLKVLDELRASGVITEDEYAKKRAEILSSL